MVAESVEGSDCLVGIIPVSGGNRTENAIRDAILSAPSATALINVTSDAYTAYWILWSQPAQWSAVPPWSIHLGER